MRYKFMILSCVSHIILILVLTVYLSSDQIIKTNSTRFLNAYAYEMVNSKLNSQKKVATAHKTEILKKLISKKKSINTNQQQKDQESSQIEPNKSEEKILALLHSAIAEKQVYPENAPALNEKATVTLGFRFLPDGRLENIAILKTSGSAILDDAALAALKEISPAKEASRYLKEATFFSIDIIFSGEN